MRNHNIEEIDGEVHHETDAAYLFSADGENKVWLPKSQCEWDEFEKVMQMPEWLAIDKGLI